MVYQKLNIELPFDLAIPPVGRNKKTEELTLKLKLQYSGHLMQRASSLEKTDAGKD